MKKYKVLGVITARGGSKGIPGKNVKLLNGKPLLSYTLTAALNSKYLDRVVVSSDSKKILDVAKKCGGESVILKRPKNLAKDGTPSLPVVKHAVREVENKMGQKFDYIALIQPTTPFLNSKDIDNVVKILIKNKARTVVSVCEVNDHPTRIKKIVNGKLIQYCKNLSETAVRRQDLPIAYKRNAGIYANTRKAVMDNNILYGFNGNCLPYIMPKERSVDINTINDFYLAEIIAKQLNKKK